MRSVLLLSLLLSLPARALAADLVVDLKTTAGQSPVPAVVWFKPAASGASARPPGAYQMVQTDVRFEPSVLVVPAGSEVSFPNRDRVRHHVYSFSPAKRFELRLYGRDETRKITFDKAGVVALGCNIHDQMTGFVVVVDTPYAVQVGPGGQARLSNLPPGGGVLTVWHPLLRSAGGQLKQTVLVPAAGAAHVSVSLDLRASPEGKTPLL